MIAEERNAQGTRMKLLLLKDDDANEHLLGFGLHQSVSNLGLNQVVYSVSRSLAPPRTETEFHQAHVAAWLSQFLGQPVQKSKPLFEIENLEQTKSSRAQRKRNRAHGPTSVNAPSPASHLSPAADTLPSARQRSMHGSALPPPSSPKGDPATTPITTTGRVKREMPGATPTRTAVVHTPVIDSGAGLAAGVSIETGPIRKQTRSMAKSLKNSVQQLSCAGAAERFDAAEVGTTVAVPDSSRTAGASDASSWYTHYEYAFFSLDSVMAMCRRC